MGTKHKCLICGDEFGSLSYDNNLIYQYHNCNICGKYIIPPRSLLLWNDVGIKNPYNKQKLASFLYYHKKPNIYYFLGTNTEYGNYLKYNPISESVLVTSEQVENWFPKTFSERIDRILLYFAQKTNYIGEIKEYIYLNLTDIFMIEMPPNLDCSRINLEGTTYFNQLIYYLNYLKTNEIISSYDESNLPPLWSTKIPIQISPKGYEKVYELQKLQANNNNVFVAMKFGEETKALREKIKEGLEGYNIRIMDEIEHNHQIVPEMLYEIRNSKFVIAELSNHNNGAYYEAGYALGLGKEVIHICQKNEMTNGLHFDVAQVNTIVYENIDEIPEKLKKRIQATIK